MLIYLVLAWYSEFLNKSIADLLSQYKVSAIIKFNNFNCENNVFNQSISFTAFFKVIYSASQELIVTEFCNLDDQDINTLSSVNK